MIRVSLQDAAYRVLCLLRVAILQLLFDSSNLVRIRHAPRITRRAHFTSARFLRPGDQFLRFLDLRQNAWQRRIQPQRLFVSTDSRTDIAFRKQQVTGTVVSDRKIRMNSHRLVQIAPCIIKFLLHNRSASGQAQEIHFPRSAFENLRTL